MSKRTQTLRGRLTSLVIVAIFGAVAIATASSVWRETAQFGAGKRAELDASAHIFASTIAEPVAMNDKAATLGALRAISYLPTIEHVRINREDGAVFVELGSTAEIRETGNGLFQENSPLSMLSSGTASATVPVRYGDETVATLTLNASTGSLWERIGTLLYDALVAAIFAGGIGMLIAMKMQRAITDPIQRLGLVMGHVRESGDFSVRADPVEDEETNQLVETFNTMLDHIQERDSKLQAHQRNLEKTVELRTREMRAAKDAAEAANVAKSDFLATMSHEIRTPMNGMLAMADLLSKARLAPRHKRYAEVIAKSGQSLLAIINDILDFSKIEAGKLQLEKIPVRPADIVDDVVGLFWERAASKNIDLAAYVAANTPEEIEGDPVRISQVLSNLVNNALKFTDHGHVVVGVALKSGGRAQDEACTLEFSVTDTGVGIDKDKQATIFEAFSQGDQTTTRRFGGTGLGLAICRRLVEAMNGKIGVKSRPGKGARFFFSTTTKTLAAAKPVRQVRDEKRAVIAIEGDATPKMLAHYLRETGVIPHIVEEGAQFGPHIACADMIFASPAFYHVYQKTISEGKAQWVPARVCICELGDVAPDALVEDGVVEDILLAPLSRREVMEQVGRIIDGRLRGKTALATTETAQPDRLCFRGQRVLAADDSAVNREVVKEALARLNLDVTLAGDGREALALVKSEPFDLILMDCSMPKMDGFEATQAIRSLEERTGRARVPIIALTAHVAGKDAAWREVGMDEYLTKPFTLDSLSGVIAQYLEADAGGRAPEADAPADEEDAPADHEDPIAPEPEEDNPVFDRTVLEQIAVMQSGAANLPLRALAIFEEHSREAIRTLANALKTGDNEAVAQAAHALKSMSVNVGARRLGAACGEIEREARNGAAKAALSALCKQAAAEFRETHRALPALMQEFKQSAA
ncbi:hybrid sensor histidine kinase/response regulator [Hyphococcus luteus]|nr:ATP-binding protein [Marinicaulis flavus]